MRAGDIAVRHADHKLLRGLHMLELCNAGLHAIAKSTESPFRRALAKHRGLRQERADRRDRVPASGLVRRL